MLKHYSRSPSYLVVLVSLAVSLTLSTTSLAIPSNASDSSKKISPIKQAKDYAIHGKVELAKAILDKILAKEPNNAEAWYLLGYVYQDMSIMDGGIKKAKDCYIKTISIDPGFGEAFRKLGEVAAIDGNWTEAIAFYNKALAAKSPDKRAYKNRAIAKSNMHQDKAALADFELYRKEMPQLANGPKGMDEYASFLENAGCYDQAIKTIEILEKTDHRSSLPVRRAKYLVKAGKTSAGIAILNNMIAKEPEDETLYADRANIFASAGKLQEALKDWDKVIELVPTSKYYESRAAVHNKLGNKQKAKADLIKAQERN
ncbi:hypothetical protein BH11CYA1_BH11CYA1_22700 [soil metagenome]